MDLQNHKRQQIANRFNNLLKNNSDPVQHQILIQTELLFTTAFQIVNTKLQCQSLKFLYKLNNHHFSNQMLVVFKQLFTILSQNAPEAQTRQILVYFCQICQNNPKLFRLLMQNSKLEVFHNLLWAGFGYELLVYELFMMIADYGDLQFFDQKFVIKYILYFGKIENCFEEIKYWRLFRKIVGKN